MRSPAKGDAQTRRLVTDFSFAPRNLTRCGNWRREESRQKKPQNNQKTNLPCISGTAGAAVLACDVLNSHVSLNVCGMLRLETTRWFPCIAILQIYKVSYFLCAGLPFCGFDYKLKQKLHSLFITSLAAFPLSQTAPACWTHLTPLQ